MKSWLFEVVKMGQIKPASFSKYEGIYCGYILKNSCDGKKVIIPKDSKERTEDKTLPVFSKEEMV